LNITKIKETPKPGGFRKDIDRRLFGKELPENSVKGNNHGNLNVCLNMSFCPSFLLIVQISQTIRDNTAFLNRPVYLLIQVWQGSQ
jgi:hypothetical protein